MKKIIVLVIIFFAMVFNTFADENVNEIEYMNFYQYGFSNRKDNLDINFMNISPLFLDNNIKFYHNYFSMDFFDNGIQNRENINGSKIYVSTQDKNNNWLDFFLFVGIFTSSVILTNRYYENQYQNNYFNEVWENQKKEHELYQRIIRNYNK
jgi:hypothetical protein